jgi:hypothetical protein
MGPLPPPPLTGSDFRLEPGASDIDAFGAHNERRIFYPISSLKHAAEMSPLRADHPWSMVGFGMRREQERGAGLRVRVFDAIGYAGYFAGPHVHIVDHWALADALIARLPAAFGRYGHFPRVIPDGYVETLLTGRTLLTDPQLAAYYDELAIVVRAPVWSWRRMLAIWRLNTGALETTLDRYAFVRAQRVAVKVQVSNPTGYACVQTYVWNGDRTSAFLLDTASRPGASYDLVWQLTADRANLLQPAGAKQLTTFDGLRDHGFFTVSLAFTDQCGGPIRELHELRYTYKREGARLIVQRQPWPVWIERFPEGPWFEGLAKGVFGVVTVVHD